MTKLPLLDKDYHIVSQITIASLSMKEEQHQSWPMSPCNQCVTLRAASQLAILLDLLIPPWIPLAVQYVSW